MEALIEKESETRASRPKKGHHTTRDLNVFVRHVAALRAESTRAEDFVSALRIADKDLQVTTIPKEKFYFASFLMDFSPPLPLSKVKSNKNLCLMEYKVMGPMH